MDTTAKALTPVGSNLSPTPSAETRKAIATEIARLLGHFWVADEPAGLRHALAADWIEDLEMFSPGVVAQACRDWRRSETRRPTIAHIRRLCIALTPPSAPPGPPPFLLPKPQREISDAEREEVARMMAAVRAGWAAKWPVAAVRDDGDPDPGLVRRPLPDLSADLEQHRARWEAAEAAERDGAAE